MPDVAGPQGTVATDSAEATKLNAKIEAQGTKVREVKAAKADKVQIYQYNLFCLNKSSPLVQKQ